MSDSQIFWADQVSPDLVNDLTNQSRVLKSHPNPWPVVPQGKEDLEILYKVSFLHLIVKAR